MAVTEINLGCKNDTPAGELHKPGKLVLSVSGPEATKARLPWVMEMLVRPKGIGKNGVGDLYRPLHNHRF